MSQDKDTIENELRRQARERRDARRAAAPGASGKDAAGNPPASGTTGNDGDPATPANRASKFETVRLLASLLAPYKRLCAATLVAMLFDLSGMLLIPTQLSMMINVAITTHDANEFMTHGVLMLIAALCGSFGYITSTWLASRLCANVGRDLRMRVYRASLDFSAGDFSRFGTGSMITRTLSDANVVQQTLLMAILMILPVPIMCAISVGLAFSIDTLMGWVLLVVTVATIAVSLVSVFATAPIFTRLQGFIDSMNARLREAITGVRVVRAFGCEDETRERLDETFSAYADNAIRVNMVFAATDTLTFFLMNAVESLVMWLGANRVGVHAMQIGSISALIEYAMLILFFLMMAQFALISVPRAMACLDRASEVLRFVPEIRDAETCVALPAPLARLEAGAKGEDAAGAPAPAEVARFDHVSLRFSDADEDTLHDLTFSIRRGEVTAIIGNTGSGKSTIAKMLLRFNDVTSGKLLFEGIDVRDVAQAELRSRIAYVPQKAWLFSGTIAENLRHGRADATDEELWHALDVAQANFVRELPGGLNAPVTQGGTNFSGGQRQRLAIARALVRHADLYVFDDSFSALDFKTDAALRHALTTELAHAAQLVIAQRVSTIHDANQIVVLKDGSIVGLGRHDELMQTCDNYRAIAESQLRKEASHE
ncbi:MAG: ABC transporter ATP-binding protein [Parolsenella sp.]|uniref:ABC transporter ATP-binding protein n=1 Tax=Parolsenella sp. TaxID=2083006 RepID=UPI002E7604D5|nr:ABC transporter ATP-binding protein [Parolsenella sp.]MEE1372607.1 ABC transporter ATP-binding protein [Parolsenella sp.]